jgi:hypothetical protein
MTGGDIKYETKQEVDHHEGNDPGLPGHHGGKVNLVAPGEHVRDGDMGARWLEEYTGERHEITDEDNNRVRNRIDRYLLPMYVSSCVKKECVLTQSIFYVYFCQQLDKSSLSFSSVFGIKTDAHLHGTEYSWLSSIVYFAQLIFQPCKSPSSSAK